MGPFRLEGAWYATDCFDNRQTSCHLYVRQDYTQYPNLRYALLLMSWHQFSREHGIKLPHVKLH